MIVIKKLKDFWTTILVSAQSAGYTMWSALCYGR